MANNPQNTTPNQEGESNTPPVINEGSENAGSNKAPVVTKSEKKLVQVDADVLQQILQNQKQLEGTITELREQQKQYEQTASQDQILKIEKLRASGKLIKSVRLNYYDNKLVTSWQPTTDDVYIDTTGKEISVQKTKVTFADGKSSELFQLDFARRKMQREYEVIKEGRDKDGNMLYTVLMDGGENVEIDGRFVN